MGSRQKYNSDGTEETAEPQGNIHREGMKLHNKGMLNSEPHLTTLSCEEVTLPTYSTVKKKQSDIILYTQTKKTCLSVM